MSKFFVSGFADWWANEPHLVLSVEAETGEPVTDLKEEHFAVGTIGGGGQFGKLAVTNQFESFGTSSGFYQLALENPQGLSYWPPAYYASLFGVEVVKDGDRGQALIANKCGGGCSEEVGGGMHRR
jgi:hypothetical protein